MTAQLHGQALLDKVAEMPDESRDVIARAAGYVTTRSGVGEVVMMSSFLQALLAAQGVTFSTGAKRRKASHRRGHVHKNGSIIIGSQHVSQLADVNVGDSYNLTIDDGRIIIDFAAAAPAEMTLAEQAV